MADDSSIAQPRGWRGHFVRRRLRSELTWTGRLLVLALAALVLAGPVRLLLPAMAARLVVDDRPSAADLIVTEVTEHPSFASFRHAADLRRAGVAPRVAMTRYVQNDRLVRAGVVLPPAFDGVLRLYWQDAGVPPDAVLTIPIDVIDPVTLNTARQVADFCARAHIARIVVVGAPFHSRRSALSYRAAGRAQGIDVKMSPAWSGLDERNWWRTKDGVMTVLPEFGKLAWYRLGASF